MRKLHLVVAVGSGLPAIVAATLAPSCGGNVTSVDATAEDAAVDDEDGPFLETDAITSVDTGYVPPICNFGQNTYIVNLPPPGVPADPGQICAVSMGPVSSNSSRVSLTKYAPQTEMAAGYVAIPPALAPLVVGLPVVTVSSATQPALKAMKVSQLAKVAGGYTFQASWPGPLTHDPGGSQMALKVSFSIVCEGGTQIVESLTNVHMCVDGQTFEWVSSGDPCTVCAQICCEMAPSPIVSDNRGDDLPLGRVIRLRLRELARVGRSVVLLAENDGGDAVEYDWQATAGHIELLAADVIVWTVPEDGQPVVQGAAWNEDGAAVSSFGWGVS